MFEIMSKTAGKINEVLIKIGKAIGKVTNPIILGLIYVFLIGLTWLYVTLAGIKTLDMKPKASTWKKVETPEPREKDCLHQW